MSGIRSPQASTLSWFVGLGIALAHGIVLACSYLQLPSSIPAFVDFSGHPVLTMPKSFFAAFRLPLMALLLQAVCAVMARSDGQEPGDNTLNRNLWAGVSVVVAAKALLSTLDLLPSGSETLHVVLRGALFAVSGAGVLFLLPNAYRLSKAYAQAPGEYFSRVGRGTWMVLGGLLTAYVGLVLAPLLAR